MKYREKYDEDPLGIGYYYKIGRVMNWSGLRTCLLMTFTCVLFQYILMYVSDASFYSILRKTAFIHLVSVGIIIIYAIGNKYFKNTTVVEKSDMKYNEGEDITTLIGYIYEIYGSSPLSIENIFDELPPQLRERFPDERDLIKTIFNVYPPIERKGVGRLLYILLHKSEIEREINAIRSNISGDVGKDGSGIADSYSDGNSIEGNEDDSSSDSKSANHKDSNMKGSNSDKLKNYFKDIHIYRRPKFKDFDDLTGVRLFNYVRYQLNIRYDPLDPYNKKKISIEYSPKPIIFQTIKPSMWAGIFGSISPFLKFFGITYVEVLQVIFEVIQTFL